MNTPSLGGGFMNTPSLGRGGGDFMNTPSLGGRRERGSGSSREHSFLSSSFWWKQCI